MLKIVVRRIAPFQFQTKLIVPLEQGKQKHLSCLHAPNGSTLDIQKDATHLFH